MRIVHSLPRVLFALSLTLAIGCGGSSTPTAPTPPVGTPAPPPIATTTVTYQGLFASGLFTGAVTMTAQVPVSAKTSLGNTMWQVISGATGTAKFAGASTTTVNLTGTYDTVTGQFVLTAPGWTIDVKGADGHVTGTISTPVGAGTVAALQATTANPVTQFCGTYGGSESGKFMVVIRNGLASGVAAEDGDPGGITLAGSANGNSVSLSWSWTDGAGGQGLAVGTINGQSISGTWSNTDGKSGTWSGSGC